jgi:Fe-S cluster assembly scaffold protein SufB
MPDFSAEFTAIAKAYEASGGDSMGLMDNKFASLVVSHNRILHSNSIPGIRIEGEETPTGARARITVEPGTRAPTPVHLCFGVLPKEGLQEIISEFHIGEGAKVNFLAHCSFPNAVHVKHVMRAHIHVAKGAEMEYSETHYHGLDGGVEVLPVAQIDVEEGAVYKSLFKLVQGAVGTLRLDYQAHLKKDAVCELDARVYGKKKDHITINESLFLDGENSRGLAKSRVVAADQCVSKVVGEAVGSAPNARGHVDCVEILKGPNARASAIPKLTVIDDRAKLTHEAAIGSVDKKQVETLMARGLSEDQAVDVVVKGMLR